ncbi:MAG: EthD family reductase [Mycobacteriaceae bacterium]
MIRLTVSYPSTPNSMFDHNYYRTTHVPLCMKTWGLSNAEIDTGVNGPNTAVVHFTFDSIEIFQTAMAADDTAIKADISNYTSIAPVLQISTIEHVKA